MGSAGCSMHGTDVEPRTGEDLLDGGDTERRHIQRRPPVEEGYVTEQRPGDVTGPDIAAAQRHYYDHRHRLDPPGEETQHLDRCRVDPVHVLDHQQRRRIAQRCIDALTHLRGKRVADREIQGRAQVPERAECAGRHQRITLRPQDSDPGHRRADRVGRGRLSGTAVADDRETRTGKSLVQARDGRMQLPEL
jgi:hypothetical protein